jgi:hypothetical protein
MQNQKNQQVNLNGIEKNEFKKNLKEMAAISKLRREIAENMYYEHLYTLKLQELQMQFQTPENKNNEPEKQPEEIKNETNQNVQQ